MIQICQLDSYSSAARASAKFSRNISFAVPEDYG